MKWLYDFAFLMFAIVSLPKFLIRLGQAESSGRLICERFGRLRPDLRAQFGGRKVLWLHAVSVGEVMAVTPWIRLFLSEYPDWAIALSTTTPTGQAVAQTIDSGRIITFYAPFDLSFSVRRALRQINPGLILLVETEIWPNLISEAHRQGIPIGIVNGRISRRSFRRYMWIRAWISALLTKLSFCFVQSGEDGDYFRRLGMPAGSILETGNMKFDRSEDDAVNLNMSGTRSGELVFVAGSTNWNEEESVLNVFRRLKEKIPALRLVLAPRHPEQLFRVRRAIQNQGLRFRLYSENHWDSDSPVLLVDQMGVLASLYSIADIVFIGGSLIPKRGGQNPVEAALLRKPVLHGPNVFNFGQVYRKLDEQGAAFTVRTEEELYQKSKLLLDDPALRERMGMHAWSTIQTMKGATTRTLEHLARWMKQEAPRVSLPI